MSSDRSASQKRTAGAIVIVSGPAGVGKTTVVNRLLELPNFEASISATTRIPRPGEEHGKHYFFMNRESFERMREEGGFLEWANVHGNYYGTPRGPVVAKLEEGKNIVLNIDVQGAAQMRRQFATISFFLMPPSLSVLRQRITNRGDAPAEIERRMQVAERELARKDEYDHRIVNDQIDKTIDEIVAILANHGVRSRETVEG